MSGKSLRGSSSFYSQLEKIIIFEFEFNLNIFKLCSSSCTSNVNQTFLESAQFVCALLLQQLRYLIYDLD